MRILLNINLAFGISFLALATWMFVLFFMEGSQDKSYLWLALADVVMGQFSLIASRQCYLRKQVTKLEDDLLLLSSFITYLSYTTKKPDAKVNGRELGRIIKKTEEI